MEERIEEKFSGPWRAVYFFAAFPIGLMLIAPFGSWLAGNGFKDILLPAAMGMAAVIFMVGFVRWLSGNQKPAWFLTDNGLLRIKTSGEQTAITWEQIKNMKLTGFGLLIWWNEPDQDKRKKIVYVERKSLLGIGDNEARELVSLWREKK